MGVPAPRISPVPPGPSLLTSARRLPSLDWVRGIEWAPACQRTFSQEFCPAEPTKELSEDRALAQAHPFMIYTPMVCDLTTVDVSDVSVSAEELTDTHTAFQLADALWMGATVEPGDVTLRGSAIDISNSTVFDLDDAVAALLSAYEDCTGGNGGAVVHMPSTLAPFALGGGSGGARVCWPEGNIYRGPLGSVIVPGPGYPLGDSAAGAGGYGPSTGSGNFAGNTDAQTWLYVSGPVEYDVGPIAVLPETERDRIPFRTNRYEVWAERPAIVRVDPCCVFAVLTANPVPQTLVVS